MKVSIIMKSEKGITMMMLIIYVASFLIVAGVIAGITVFFYNNSSLIDKENFSAIEFNKLNMYLVKESELPDNRIETISLSDEETTLQYILFSNGDKFVWDKESNLLYFNQICLCEDVQGLKATAEYSTGKEVLSVKIDFTNKSYSCKYTMR